MGNVQGKSRGLGNGEKRKGAAEQSPEPLLPHADILELKRGENSTGCNPDQLWGLMKLVSKEILL